MPNGKEGGRGRDWEGRERGWWEEVMGWRKWCVCADVVDHCFKPIWNRLDRFRTIRDRFGRNGDGDGAKGVGGERGATTSWGGAEANGRGLGGRGEEG